MRTLLRILPAVFFSLTAHACIWDAQSLSHEKSRSHDLAQTILGESSPSENTNQLRATIKELEANRKEDDVSWWNNLAGAHLRLNEPQAAAALLEPVVAKFPDDYGIHANLGTAYHLLGRYKDAEKEIARDLEINPNAHFGLEKYHLALLQYLAREPKYQARHVYVDEYTAGFLTAMHGGHVFWDAQDVLFQAEGERDTNNAAAAEAEYESLPKTNKNDYATLQMLATVAAADAPPAYRKLWDLGADTNLEAGVIYMAQMNPKEPACQVMLGIAAWKALNYHLAATAFDHAIGLGSPQADLLKQKSDDLQEFIRHSEGEKQSAHFLGITVLGLPVALILFFILRDLRRKWRKAKPAEQSKI
jgi:hypothetical protein